MTKIIITAIREFRSTALTRAFLFGVVLFPLIIIGGIMLISVLGILDSEKAPVEGEIAIADGTPGGIVAQALEATFDPEVMKARAEATREAVSAELEKRFGEQMNSPMAQAALAAAFDRPMNITVTLLPSDYDADVQKERIRSGALLAFIAADERTMALPGDLPEMESDGLDPRNLRANTYYLSHDPSLDGEVIDDVERVVRETVARARLMERGYDPAEIDRLSDRPRAMKVSITESGEQKSVEELNFIIPMVFMMLIWISVMSGGQYLLMSTIEEKSSRVMEVLLSAISPMQLMVGKIVGQGFVGLLILLIYAGIGLLAADRFSVMGLVPKDKLPWLVLYFLMAYFFFAALMAAVGSAVTEIREAQSLMGPIMTLLMFPLFLWFVIIDNPNSLFAQIMSFIPPVTPFVMILRMSQTTDPVPLWQVAATTIVGFAGVAATVWAATKIFRVGVLMYGTPPTLMGLIKWLRYA